MEVWNEAWREWNASASSTTAARAGSNPSRRAASRKTVGSGFPFRPKLTGVDPIDLRVEEPAGVEAGRRGGFALVIGVDRGGHGRELRERGADVLIGDLGEVRVSATASDG